jgi:hypothetical protein
MKRVFRQACLCGLAIVVCATFVLSQNSEAASAGRLSDMKLPSRDVFGKRVELSGELEVIVEDYQNSFKIERFVKTTEGRIPLEFHDSPEAKSGSRISLTGISFDGKIDVETYSTSQTEALAGTTGEKKVLVILVNFQDKQTQPYTLERASDVTFNTTSNFFRENSYGQTWLTGDVYGWYTIPIDSTVCDKNAIATYAQQAAANAGANLAAYSNIVYGFPQNGCSFSGSSSVGGSPSHSWIRGDWYGIEVLGHELGHGFGLLHSRALDCGNEVVNGICSTIEYGDKFDIMGPNMPYHYNAYQKERLGWVNSGSSPVVQTVSADGTYYLDAYETAGAGTKGLKILKSIDPTTGARTWYYIEHRTATGFDSGLSVYNLQNGVVFHTGSDGDGQDNYLLDMTPLTASWYDSFLGLGQTYSDSNIGLVVSVLSADNTGATVQIQVAAQPCVRANPTVSVTPGQSSWLLAGTVVPYQVSVRNNNSGGCSSEAFNIAASMPGGFSASYLSPSLSLGNGENGVAGVNVASAGLASDGVYNLSFSAANAANSSNAASALASYVIISRIDITAAAGAARYTRTQTATVTAQVMAGGAPLGNTAVTFKMIRPDGRYTNQIISTGADGRAVFSYRLDKKRDLIGTYTVVPSASANGRTGQASVSFVVYK